MINKFNTYFFRPDLLNEDTAVELNEITGNYPWFQLAWMLYAKNLKQIQSPEYENVVKKTMIMVNNRKMFLNFLNSNVRLTRENITIENSFLLTGDKEINESSSNSLIDRFLSSNSGSLTRNTRFEVTKEKYDHQEILEKSETENDELITETLANIYFQQKNYVKAIQAFEKLSLKYPEKSIYFATRIKEAENFKNTN